MIRPVLLAAVAAVPLLVASLPAQARLVPIPSSVSLRPGQTTCVTVATAPPATNLTITPSFDGGLLGVSPAVATTNSAGEATFVLTYGAVALLPTAVAFQASGYAQGATQVQELPTAVRLGGTAGSDPGLFQATLTAASPLTPGTPAVIPLSPTPGPLVLALIDPNDPRTLTLGAVGLQVLPGFAGLFLPPSTTFQTPSFQVPPLGFEATLYFQGLTLDVGGGGIVGSISQPAPVYFQAAHAFHTRGATLLKARSFFPVIENQDGLPLAIGGGQGAVFAQVATKTTEVYDPVSDSYFPGPDMTSERSLHTATKLPNGKWLVVGGVNGQNDPIATAELYDPASDSFVAVGSMSTPRAGHTASLLPNGSVLVTGGLTMVLSNDILGTIASATATTEIFTLDASGCNGSFKAGPTMTRARAGHVAQTLADGRVYLLGGVGPGFLSLPSIWSQTELYSPTNNSFAGGPSMPNARAIFPLVQIGSNPDRYLAAGGLNSVLGLGAPTAAADVYTAQSGQAGSWSRAGTMATTRTMQAAVRFGNEVIEIGGLTGDLVTSIAVGTSEIYDIPTGTWHSGPSLTKARGAYGWYQSPWGAVHLLGGAAGPGQNPPVGNDDDWWQN